MPGPPAPLDGTQTPLSSPAVREAHLDAVREANGRRALLPADDIDGAVLDVESWLIVPEWATGETAAGVAASMLLDVYGLDVLAGAAPLVWSLYAAAARRLGFPGAVPVPMLDSLGTAAQA